jgi:SAM-dependent methyltransferase
MSSTNVVSSVAADRWRAAQSWEEGHWVAAQRARSRFGKNWVWRALRAAGLVSRYRGDDWNGWWQKAFNDYAFLPAEVDNALEVGCGPYTNVRLMRGRCRMRHLFLSDPLIRTYVRFKLTFVAEAYREASCVLDDHPLEELPFAPDYFDLTVMINVLDHVRDADACMRNLIRVTKPGGIVVLGQDLTDDEDRAKIAGGEGEVGHPIKLDHVWFEQHLKTGFEPIQHEVLPRERGRAPEHHYGTLLFAGRKRPAA